MPTGSTMSEDKQVNVGTRGSLLARTQTEQVLAAVRTHCPEVRFETTIITTSGDESSGLPKPAISETGYFTREIEEALLTGKVDVAVHSLKDLPTEVPDDLRIVAIPERQDPRDAIIGVSRDELGQATAKLKIGTSSLRRTSQLKQLFPCCNVVPLRGNIDTRLRKVREGVVDCAILALAGLLRAGRGEEVTSVFDVEEMLPAPAQGALAIEIRKGDTRTASLFETIHCTTSASCVAAERAFMKQLGGGCHVPVAALATVNDNVLHLKGRVVSLDGIHVFEDAVSGPPTSGSELGSGLADVLLSEGAKAVLSEIEHNLNKG